MSGGRACGGARARERAWRPDELALAAADNDLAEEDVSQGELLAGGAGKGDGHAARPLRRRLRRQRLPPHPRRVRRRRVGRAGKDRLDRRAHVGDTAEHGRGGLPLQDEVVAKCV